MTLLKISNKITSLTKITCLAILLLLTACADTSEKEYKERSVEEIYNQAMDFLDSNKLKDAALAFDEVDRQHPYSKWATKSQLMSAYVYYRNNKYDEAIIALDRFIDLHPGNKDTPYAYYLRAITYYEQITDIQRDQKITGLALRALSDIVNRYPESEYARDAKLKIDLSLNHLAGKEMAIGRFYQKRKEYLAAINRYRTVIQHFQTTSHVEEALHRLVETYLSLGIEDEAQMAAAVLGHNFIGSRWYQNSYTLLTRKGLQPAEKENSWLSPLWNWSL